MTDPAPAAFALAAPQQAARERITTRPVTTRLLYGDFLTGEIAGEIDATSFSWEQELNAAGTISEVHIPEPQVRALGLRWAAPAVKGFLAVEQNGRIREAGPIWSRTWDWEAGVLKLGAGGFWSWLNRRIVQKAGQSALIVSGKSLGGIARQLVTWCAVDVPYSDPPIVLPDDEVGDHTETFPRWNLTNYGEQLRQITQRAVNAPDIRFRPRRRPDDATRIEWVMEVGTADAPELAQVGNDWIFDTTVPRSPVLGIGTDEDGSAMAEQAWVIGNGQEEDMLLAFHLEPELLDRGWPLTEIVEDRTTVEDQFTLEDHAEALAYRSGRPIEAIKVAVHASAATEVLAGHYCRIATKGDAWLPDGEHRMRVAKVSGTQGDNVTLDMYPLQAIL